MPGGCTPSRMTSVEAGTAQRAPWYGRPMTEPVKLHRCSWTFLHVDMDACWKVERALKEEGISYEVVKHGYGKSEKGRADVIELSGQKLLPVLEMPDGEVYRADSDDMAERVRTGSLGDAAAAPPVE